MTTGKLDVIYHPDSQKEPSEVIRQAAAMATHLGVMVRICIRSQRPSDGVRRISFWGIGPNSKDSYLNRSIGIIAAMRQT